MTPYVLDTTIRK